MQLGIELIGDVLDRHTWPPILLRFQLDPCLDHGEWRWIGCSIGAPGLAEDTIDFWHGLDDAVCLAKNLPHLGG